MPLHLRLVIYSTLLAWLMILTASFVRNRGWTRRGLRIGVGNRDDVFEPTPLSERTDRAARNMLENLLLFVPLVLVAHLVDADPNKLAQGARIFFWARVVYFPLYVLGVQYLRSIAWAVAAVGMWMIVQTLLQ